MASSDNVLSFPKRRSAPDDAPPIELNEVIGEVLRDERVRQGRTLGDVAERASVSLPYLSEVERGRKEPSSPVLRSISDALGMPLPDVLDESARRLRRQLGTRRTDVQMLAA